MFVLVSTEWVMLCPAIDNPASCEICYVVRFLHAKNMNAAQLHRVLYAVYGQNVMREVTVIKLCRIFEDERESKCSRWTAKWSAGHLWWVMFLLKVLTKKLWKRRFTISELSCQFPQILVSVLCKIIIFRLGYHKFWARWVQKILTGAHKTQIMASALTSLEWYHKHGD
jgi:hypothetical protein